MTWCGVWVIARFLRCLFLHARVRLSRISCQNSEALTWQVRKEFGKSSNRHESRSQIEADDKDKEIDIDIGGEEKRSRLLGYSIF